MIHRVSGTVEVQERCGDESGVGGLWVCHSVTVLSCSILLGRMDKSSTGKTS